MDFGGAIYLNSSSVDFKYTKFYNNYARIGGAIKY
jgi:hypothetical protein